MNKENENPYTGNQVEDTGSDDNSIQYMMSI